VARNGQHRRKSTKLAAQKHRRRTGGGGGDIVTASAWREYHLGKVSAANLRRKYVGENGGGGNGDGV